MYMYRYIHVSSLRALAGPERGGLAGGDCPKYVDRKS